MKIKTIECNFYVEDLKEVNSKLEKIRKESNLNIVTFSLGEPKKTVE